jgi:hypothetical protein
MSRFAGSDVKSFPGRVLMLRFGALWIFWVSCFSLAFEGLAVRQQPVL